MQTNPGPRSSRPRRSTSSPHGARLQRQRQQEQVQEQHWTQEAGTREQHAQHASRCLLAANPPSLPWQQGASLFRSGARAPPQLRRWQQQQSNVSICAWLGLSLLLCQLQADRVMCQAESCWVGLGLLLNDTLHGLSCRCCSVKQACISTAPARQGATTCVQEHRGQQQQGRKQHARRTHGATCDAQHVTPGLWPVLPCAGGQAQAWQVCAFFTFSHTCCACGISTAGLLETQHAVMS